MIESDELYTRLEAMTEEERIEILDPIINAVRGKVQVQPGCEVIGNRIFALAVLDLYKEWQLEIWSRE
jgi:hypothetical protein